MNENDVPLPEQSESTESFSFLDPVEARVLACLIEKEITTPEYYPLTLKALTAACNQKSNRYPVMTLEEDDVSVALESLRYTHHLAWHVSSAGSRVAKYKHGLLEKLAFNSQELAIVCELILRGPQTQGELRTHCQRMVPFESVEQVHEIVEGLKDWAGFTLVTQLPPCHGRREPRYAHLLCGDEGLLSEDTDAPPGTTAPPPTPPREARIAALEEKVEHLTKALDALSEQFDAFRQQFE